MHPNTANSRWRAVSRSRSYRCRRAGGAFGLPAKRDASTGKLRIASRKGHGMRSVRNLRAFRWVCSREMESGWRTSVEVCRRYVLLKARRRTALVDL